MSVVLTETLTPIAGGLREFEESFARALGGHAGLIGEMSAHILTSPGKRIRPALYLLSSGMPSIDRPIPVDAAVAIELIHTATLLHDDVNDGAEERRGRPAASQLWGNLAAVLMGDHLFAKAFRLMVDRCDHDAVQTIAAASERVSVGELLQVQESRNFNATEDTYLRIIADKTASLFSAACEAGALANGRRDDREMFREFGECVGLGFQIADDLLDYIGDAEMTGKPAGSDIQSGQVTLPLIFALRSADARARARMVDHLSRPGENGLNDVIDFVRTHGGFEYARQRADGFRTRALNLIAGLRTPFQPALEEIVNLSVDRES